jgi:hypothetical protein
MQAGSSLIPTTKRYMSRQGDYLGDLRFDRHYGSQSRGRRPRALGTALEAVGIGCADGGRRHKAVGLGRRQYS